MYIFKNKSLNVKKLMNSNQANKLKLAKISIELGNNNFIINHVCIVITKDMVGRKIHWQIYYLTTIRYF